MARRNINKVALLRGIYINKEDKRDFVQDCINYIIEKGNIFDKNGNPIIKNEFTNSKNKNRMSAKTYYYVMRNIENYKNVDINTEYDENRNYDNYSEDDDDIEKCIYENINDKMEQEIFLKLYRKGYTKVTIEEISNKYNLDFKKISEIINRNRDLISSKI